MNLWQNPNIDFSMSFHNFFNVFIRKINRSPNRNCLLLGINYGVAKISLWIIPIVGPSVTIIAVITAVLLMQIIKVASTVWWNQLTDFHAIKPTSLMMPTLKLNDGYAVLTFPNWYTVRKNMIKSNRLIIIPRDGNFKISAAEKLQPIRQISFNVPV